MVLAPPHCPTPFLMFHIQAVLLEVSVQKIRKTDIETNETSKENVVQCSLFLSKHSIPVVLN